MSKANPYDSFLDGRPILEILATTADAVSTLLATIGEARATVAPAPGKWSAAEIVAHLADCDLAFGFRLRQTLAEDAPVIQPFDQEKWAATYPGVTAAQAVAGFASFRAWNLRLIELALPTSADRKMTHPERGEMTFQTVVETMAGHDLNHLGQLRALANSKSS